MQSYCWVYYDFNLHDRRGNNNLELGLSLMKHPIKKFCRSVSIPLWNPEMTVEQNSWRLNISLSYAYAFARRHSLKFKHDFKAGQRATDKHMRFNSPYLPSHQKFAWDECPENCLNEDT
jgi:hypothetical protein